MGHKKPPSTATRICRCEKKKQRLKMQDAHLARNAAIFETDTSRTSKTSTIRSTIRRVEKTSITMSIGKLDGGTTETHGETRWQRLHLQHCSGKTQNGKRVGAHGIPHHLIKCGDFGFLRGIPENRRGCRQDTTHNTHLCSTVCAQARNARHALGSSHTDCIVIFVSEKSLVIWCVTCLIRLFSHQSSSMSTSSSSPTCPTTHREHSVHPAHLQALSVDKLRHQESLWSEDLQSGGNPRTTTPTSSLWLLRWFFCSL